MLLGGSLGRQLELRTWRKVLDVVRQVIGAGKRLSADVDLTAGNRQQSDNRWEGQNAPDA